jgi:hypothetical protein
MGLTRRRRPLRQLRLRRAAAVTRRNARPGRRTTFFAEFDIIEV